MGDRAGGSAAPLVKHLHVEFEFLATPAPLDTSCGVSAHKYRMLKVQIKSSLSSSQEVELIQRQLWQLCKEDDILHKAVRQQQMLFLDRDIGFTLKVLDPKGKQWCRIPSRDPRLQKIPERCRIRVGLELRKEDQRKIAAHTEIFRDKINENQRETNLKDGEDTIRRKEACLGFLSENRPEGAKPVVENNTPNRTLNEHPDAYDPADPTSDHDDDMTHTEYGTYASCDTSSDDEDKLMIVDDEEQPAVPAHKNKEVVAQQSNAKDDKPSEFSPPPVTYNDNTEHRPKEKKVLSLQDYNKKRGLAKPDKKSTVNTGAFYSDTLPVGEENATSTQEGQCGENENDKKTAYDIDNDDVGLADWKDMLGINEKEDSDRDTDHKGDNSASVLDSPDVEANSADASAMEMATAVEDDEADSDQRIRHKKKIKRRSSGEIGSSTEKKRSRHKDEAFSAEADDNDSYTESRRRSKKHKKTKKHSRSRRKRKRRSRSRSPNDRHDEDLEDGEILTDDEHQEEKEQNGSAQRQGLVEEFTLPDLARPPPTFNPHQPPPGMSRHFPEPQMHPDGMPFHRPSVHTFSEAPRPPMFFQPPPQACWASLASEPPAPTSAYSSERAPPSRAEIVAATLDLTNKSPVSALHELCARYKWPTPQFVLHDSTIEGSNRVWKMSVKVQDDTHIGDIFRARKDQSKADAARKCLTAMGIQMET